MRHQGEKQIPTTLERWDIDGHVAHSIATETHWLDAWLMQNGTPYVHLSALTGIPVPRFAAITRGYAVSRAEIDALARAWSMSASNLLASIGGRTEIID